MRIALVTNTFLPKIGGGEFVVHHLACQWRLQGHEVCVINTITDRATHPDATYTVRKFKRLKGGGRFGRHRFPFNLYDTRSVQKLLFEFKPDFISAHFGYPTGIWLSKIDGLPKYLVTCHGPAVTEVDGFHGSVIMKDSSLAKALNKASGVVAISRHARRVLESKGVMPDKILDIPNGVDCKSFSKTIDFDLRSRFGIPQNGLVILSVGRNAPTGIKAYDVGIKAFAKLNLKAPNTYYIILGDRTEEWLPLTLKLGIEKKVFFSKLRGDDLIGSYQQADIFFSCSAWELCPLVVLEAMAAAQPTVVTNVSGSQDLITTGHNGIVVEPGQPNEMADALYQLVRDESLRKRFGKANLEKSKEYDWSIISQKYLEHV